MGNIETLNLKKLGDNKNVELELDTTTIEKFVNEIDNETLMKLEKYMGNKEDYEDEYIIIDQDYSFLDEAGIDKDHLLNLSDFLEINEVIQNKDGEEICTGFVNIPKEGDYKAIVVNTNSDSYILVSEKDIKDIIVGIYTSDYSDIKKTKPTKAIKDQIEELEKDLEKDEIEGDEISLDDLNEDDLNEDSSFER